MITIQVAGKECTVEQAERSYSALLRPSHGEWWIGFERTDREFYQRHGPQAGELKGDTSTPVDIFIWKLGFEEAFAASNMEWVEGLCPFRSNRWDVELPIPGYLAYDVFSSKIPVRYAERLLDAHAAAPGRTSNKSLQFLGLKGRSGLRFNSEGSAEWGEGPVQVMIDRWFDRLREKAGAHVTAERWKR